MNQQVLNIRKYAHSNNRVRVSKLATILATKIWYINWEYASIEHLKIYLLWIIEWGLVNLPDAREVIGVCDDVEQSRQSQRKRMINPLDNPLVLNA